MHDLDSPVVAVEMQQRLRRRLAQRKAGHVRNTGARRRWICAGPAPPCKRSPRTFAGSRRTRWPAAGFVDTEKRCFMKLEVGYGEANI